MHGEEWPARDHVAGPVPGYRRVGTFKGVDPQRGAMSVETTSLEALGAELGEAIADSPAYEEFIEKKEAVEDHDEVQERLQAFQEQRQDFMMAKQSGDATPEDFASLQQTQFELNSHPVMDEYLEAQQALEQRLGAIEEAISEPLVIDFGEMGGGCCKE